MRAPAGIRPIEALARLKPVFALPDGEDRGDATSGTVTAGNAPGITDGAAATVVVSERDRRALRPASRSPGSSATPRRRWHRSGCSSRRSRASAGCSIGSSCRSRPSTSSRSTRRSPPRSLADGRELGFDWDKVNVNGGAIALGHPVGASRSPDRRDPPPRARSGATDATALRPCAWAAAGRWRWPSSGSDRSSARAGAS